MQRYNKVEDNWDSDSGGSRFGVDSTQIVDNYALLNSEVIVGTSRDLSLVKHFTNSLASIAISVLRMQKRITCSF